MGDSSAAAPEEKEAATPKPKVALEKEAVAAKPDEQKEESAEEAGEETGEEGGKEEAWEEGGEEAWWEEGGEEEEQSQPDKERTFEEEIESDMDGLSPDSKELYRASIAKTQTLAILRRSSSGRVPSPPRIPRRVRALLEFSETDLSGAEATTLSSNLEISETDDAKAEATTPSQQDREPL